MDEEFALLGADSQVTAIDAPAADKIDLLTVIAHEPGHLAGLPDVDGAIGSLMSGSLAAGSRRSV